MPKTIAEPTVQKSETTPLELQDLTNQVLNSILPKATENQCVFINDIPAHLSLETDAQRLKGLLRKLFSLVVTHTKDSYIRLRTKVYGNVVLLHMEDVISDLNKLENELKQLQPAAEQMMSTVMTNSWRKNHVVVTFGFTNLPPLD